MIKILYVSAIHSTHVCGPDCELHPDQAAFERDEEMFGPQDADLDTPSNVELLDLAREIRNARLARAEEDRRRAWADYEAEAAELSEPLAEVAA